MYTYTYDEYKRAFTKVFAEEKRLFRNKVHLISACQNTIEIMMQDYIMDKNNVLSSFGDSKNTALAFVYTDARIISVIDTCIKNVIANEPKKYRLTILSASVFLTFLYNQKWFSQEYLDNFYQRYDPNKIVQKKN